MSRYCGRMVEWFKAAVLKTAEGQLSVGSNPTPSAIFFAKKMRWSEINRLKSVFCEAKIEPDGRGFRSEAIGKRQLATKRKRSAKSHSLPCVTHPADCVTHAHHLRCCPPFFYLKNEAVHEK